MAPSLRSRFAPFVVALGIASLSALSAPKAAIAVIFGQKEVDQNDFAVLASPFGSGSYQLLILEQLNNKRPCWSESGSNPIIVDPLLLQFDFTGICARSTDSNGYSVRMAGRDFGLLQQLSVVRRENDLVLISTDLTNRDSPPLIIGQTNGLPPAGQFAKITLNPGWRLTKRTDGSKELGMVYLTSDTVPSFIKLTAFVDTQASWAKDFIDALAAQKIVSGFEDGGFHPNDPVTRVQFAAMVNKAFAYLQSQRAGITFKDIKPDFWGAEAIQTAYQKGFMSGYPDGTFKPNQQIPRMEVLVALANGLQLASQNTSALSFYQDAAQIPDWATGPIAGATERRIVVNFPRVRQLNPTGTATRADVAAFIYQALVNAGRMPTILSPFIVDIGTPTPANPLTTPTEPGTPPTAPTTPSTPIQPPPADPITPTPTPTPTPTTPSTPSSHPPQIPLLRRLLPLPLPPLPLPPSSHPPQIPLLLHPLPRPLPPLPLPPSSHPPQIPLLLHPLPRPLPPLLQRHQRPPVLVLLSFPRCL
ncbi:DUF3747 domain-containing protein [Kovacikia minuta]|uniref:DUF3747 domain-containing protein n=1 Tax=Kovacikia minuta TaxID=2931930 RepID=UPI0026760847|nr:DUF3747 domain-containing protein [Kovacikia minuta]